ESGTRRLRACLRSLGCFCALVVGRDRSASGAVVFAPPFAEPPLLGDSGRDDRYRGRPSVAGPRAFVPPLSEPGGGAGADRSFDSLVAHGAARDPVSPW